MYVEKSLHFDELKYFANECEGQGPNHRTYTNKWLKHLKSQQISRALKSYTNWGHKLGCMWKKDHISTRKNVIRVLEGSIEAHFGFEPR